MLFWDGWIFVQKWRLQDGCLRCIGPSNFFLERVLFPTDILTFMAPNDSRVEIWGNELYGPKLEERIRISADNEDSTLVA